MHRHLLGTAAALALLAGPAFAQDAAPVAAAGGAACAPTITVTQSPPEVRVTLPEMAGAEPVVTVIQAPPRVEVTPCPAVEGMAAAEPEIIVNAAETAELMVARQGGQAGAAMDESGEPAAPMAADATAGNPPASNLNTQATEAEGATQAQAQANAGIAAPAGDMTEETPDGMATDTGADMAATATEGDADTAGSPTGPTGPDAGDQTIANGVNEGGATGAQPASGGIALQDGAITQPDQPNPVAGELMEPAPEPQDEDVIDGPLTEPLPDAAAAPVQADPAPPPAPLPSAEAPADMQTPDPVEGARPEGAEPLRDTAAEVAAEEAVVDAMNDGAEALPADAARPAASLREGNTAVDGAEAMQGDLEGIVVIASDDEEVGQIQRVEPDAIVVSVGGFLGIGQRDVLIPMSELSFQRDGAGELRTYLAFASDQLQALPEAPAAE